MQSFGIYAIGLVLLIVGIMALAAVANIPWSWAIVASLFVAGLAVIIGSLKMTRRTEK